MVTKMETIISSGIRYLLLEGSVLTFLANNQYLDRGCSTFLGIYPKRIGHAKPQNRNPSTPNPTLSNDNPISPKPPAGRISNVEVSYGVWTTVPVKLAAVLPASILGSQHVLLVNSSYWLLVWEV